MKNTIYNIFTLIFLFASKSCIRKHLALTLFSQLVLLLATSKASWVRGLRNTYKPTENQTQNIRWIDLYIFNGIYLWINKKWNDSSNLLFSTHRELTRSWWYTQDLTYLPVRNTGLPSCIFSLMISKWINYIYFSV